MSWPTSRTSCTASRGACCSQQRLTRLGDTGSCFTPQCKARPAGEGAVATAPDPPEQQTQFGLEVVPARGSTLDSGLANDDTDFVGFMRRQYKLTNVRVVRGKEKRILAALQGAGGAERQLSLERDVLPKLQLLEALSPGLGWAVVKRCPEEFASPEALDCWQMAAAYLHTVGIPPRQITALFVRHPLLFRQAVSSPDNLRRLFEWLQRDLGLAPAASLKIIKRYPTILQSDVEAALKPRLQFLLDLGLPQERAVTAVKLMPEVLGVDSALLADKAAYLQREAGLTGGDVAALLAREPAALLCSRARLEGVVGWLRGEVRLEGPALRRALAKGGVTKYPLATLKERVAFWRGLGFGADELRDMLARLPRLLLYPAHEPKYQLKLRFLQEELGLPLQALAGTPAYLTYSLPARIAPRAAAARELAGRTLSLPQLFHSDAAFARSLGVEPDEWLVFATAWQAREEAQRWADPPPPSRRGGRLPAAEPEQEAEDGS